MPRDEVRTAELIAALCLATDLGMELPFEHGLHSTVIGMRLADRAGVDAATAAQVYYGCLLFYAGCTADAEIAAELFEDGAAVAHFTPVMFGTPSQTAVGILRAMAGSGPVAVRAVRLAAKLPKAAGTHRAHVTALCEVAQMLSERLGLPAPVGGLFAHLTDRWDERGDALPVALRIVHVARDAAFQRLLGGPSHARAVLAERAGAAFDPAVVALVDDAVLAVDDQAWDETLAREPGPHLMLRGDAIDRALAAMGDFADLASPYLVGHSAGVAALARAAAGADVDLYRAALVHDLGRVGVPARIWQKPGPLTRDEWERVRLHAYHAERILCRSPFLAELVPAATAHHERLDGGGYHRGAPAAALGPAARLLAAADAYHAMTEPRPHRAALPVGEAASRLAEDGRAGRLDPDAVAAVLAAAGHPPRRVGHPAGLTDREAQVVTLLARGLQTKQIARTLGISPKTADRHVQNAYAKIGVSTRAAAALFAMHHGLVGWGELPIPAVGGRS